MTNLIQDHAMLLVFSVIVGIIIAVVISILRSEPQIQEYYWNKNRLDPHVKLMLKSELDEINKSGHMKEFILSNPNPNPMSNKNKNKNGNAPEVTEQGQNEIDLTETVTKQEISDFFKDGNANKIFAQCRHMNDIHDSIDALKAALLNIGNEEEQE